MRKLFLILIFLFYFSSQAGANPFKELFEQGIMAYNAGRYEDAVKIFQKTVEIYPLPQAYNFLALSQKELGADEKELVFLLSKAVELDPEYAEAHDHLSKIYYAIGNFDAAERHGLKALELQPNNIGVQLSLGWIYLLGKAEAYNAIPYFEKVVATQQSAYAYLGLGMAYIVDDQHFKTLEMITKLRGMGEDDLASQLEVMMHERKFVPIKSPIGPMLVPESRAGELVKDFPAQSQYAPSMEMEAPDMQVRIRKKPKTTIGSGRSDLYDPNMTGTERIKALQQRGASGAAY